MTSPQQIVDAAQATVDKAVICSPPVPTVLASAQSTLAFAQSWAGPDPMPAWLVDKPLNEWIAIPGTEPNSMTAAELAPQIAAGLCSSSGAQTTFGNPRSGILNFSGGAIKRDGSEMLCFGGGGAGAWGGNDVRSLRLADNTPRWRTRVNPSPSTALWPYTGPGRTAHPYMQDGRPNARHSYWQSQFIDSQDRFMAFGCQNVFELDQGTYNVVDSAVLDGDYVPAGTHPSIPHARGYDGSWVCKDPRDEKVYASSAQAVDCFDPSTNTWTNVVNNGGWNGIERGCAAVDTNRGKLLRIGQYGAAYNRPITIDLATHAATVANLTGPDAALIVGSWSAGFVFDPALDAFLFFNDRGLVHTLRYVSDSEWSADHLVLTGTPPASAGSAVRSGGFCNIYGSMQYAPELKGFAILQRASSPMFFVKTA